MRGACTIDGIDIDDLGMLVLKGGDYDLLLFPERKEPLQNDWFEYDGLDVDLSEIYFKDRAVNMKFYMRSDDRETFLNNLDTLYDMLSASGFRNIYIREFNRSFLLRYVSCSAFKQRGGLIGYGTKSAEFTVVFNMDDPLQMFSQWPMLPVGQAVPEQYVKINNIDMSGFGITVQHIYSSALRFPQSKSVLTRSFERGNGLFADTAVRPKNKYSDIKIGCTMSARGLDDFYENYDSLFNQMRKTGVVSVDIPGKNYECYYSKMDGFKKIVPFRQRVMVSFNLNLKRI